MAHAGYCDMLLLHRLQQGGLGARRGAVDLVRHQQLREHRPLEEAETALPARALVQHFGAEDVGGHKVRRELDALVGEAQGGAHRFHEARLGKPRRADQQRVAAGQNRCQRQLDHSLLAKDGPADFGLYAGQRFGCRVGVRHRGFRT